MEEELNLISNNLNAALAKLKTSTTTAWPRRKENLAKLIKLHLRHIQQTVITNRRRSQQRSRRRFKQLRSFFMQQMMDMQTSYLQMFAMLRLKHSSLITAEKEPQEEQQTPCFIPPATPQFYEFIMPGLSDEEFLAHLHVTRSTFQTLCRQLATTLRTAEDLQPSPMISPHKCVALALLFLASGERISLLADQFGLPRSRAIKCLKLFCNAVMSSLGKALRLLPQSPADCDNVVAGFQRESNMPAALVGVLGVCSIPIRASGSLYMEFLLDDRMLFRELQLGNGNRAASGQLTPMFSASPNGLTNLPPRRINGRQVAAFVLAPAQYNYPLRPWLLQRYADPMAPHEHDFNEVAEHLQELSDCALHRLMSRWHFLNQPLDISFQTASCIITAATVLHNLLEELREPHLLEWGNSVDVSKFRAQIPVQIKEEEEPEMVQHALDVRDFLARTISSTEL